MGREEIGGARGKGRGGAEKWEGSGREIEGKAATGGGKGAEGGGAAKDIERTEGTTVGGKEGTTENSPPEEKEREERGVEEDRGREVRKEEIPESEKGKRRPVGDNEEATDKSTLTGLPRTRNWSVPPGTLVKRPKPGEGEPVTLTNPDLAKCSTCIDTDTLGGGGGVFPLL